MSYDDFFLRYGLGGNPIDLLFGKRQSREIIDVDYVDVSDEAEALPDTKLNLLKHHNDATTPKQELKQ